MKLLKRVKWFFIIAWRKLTCDCRGKMIGPRDPADTDSFTIRCFWCGCKHVVNGHQWKNDWRAYHYFNAQISEGDVHVHAS